MTEQRWALLAADTDRTQEYVFESSRLPEIRGASRILDDLNEWAGDQISREGGDVIIAAGGMLLALVPKNKADDLAKAIERQYPIETHNATTTVTSRPVTDEMLTDGFPKSDAVFGSLMNWVGMWLRREKDGREYMPWHETCPHAERCHSCQIRPADADRSLPDLPLCFVCSEKKSYKGLKARRQEKHQIGRDYWFNRFQQFLEKNEELSDQYYQGQHAFPNIQSGAGNYWTPQDLSEIGQACQSRKGYVGYIYLDGDEMGKVFSQIETKEQAKALSGTLENAAHNSVMSALAKHLHPAKIQPSESRAETGDETPQEAIKAGTVRIHPFEIITIGGDDLILIVPADVAIPLACEISQSFQTGMDIGIRKNPILTPLAGKPFTLSGGVVLADDHNPVRALQDLAKVLKSSAKQARHNLPEGEPQEGYLDFIALMGTDMPDRDLIQSRKLYPYHLQQPGQPRPVTLLGRPYPVSRLADAWPELKTLKAANFATTQMALLAQKLLEGVQLSGLFFEYQRARDKSGAFTHLEAAMRILQNAPDTHLWQVFTPQHSQGIRAQTVLWDIAEIYSLI